MCVGVVDEAKVEYAAGARHLQGQVQHGFDGQGCHEWNEIVRQGAAFQVAAKTSSGGGKRWRSSVRAWAVRSRRGLCLVCCGVAVAAAAADVCSVLCVCVCGCTVLAAGVTECLCLRAQGSFARIGLRGMVEDIGGEGRALWRMIYHILGIIVVPPLDQVLLASQPCISMQQQRQRQRQRAE
jgi:hypothetical protein